MNSDVTGWIIPSTTAVSMIGARSAEAADRMPNAAAVINPNVVSSFLMIPPWARPSGRAFLESPPGRSSARDLVTADLLQKRFRVRRSRIELQCALGLRACGGRVPQLQIRLPERHVRRRGVPAPDRDFQRIDGLAGPAGAEIDAPDQQVRGGLVGREEDGAPELREGFAVLLHVEQALPALEIELRDALLIPLRGGRQHLVDDGPFAERLEVLPDTLEPMRQRRPRTRVEAPCG